MAGIHKEFDSWLPGKIRKPSEAAYFLAATLEDAIEQKDMSHFVKGLVFVSKEHHLDLDRTISMTFENLNPEDAPSFQGNIGILVANMVLNSKEFQQIPG